MDTVSNTGVPASLSLEGRVAIVTGTASPLGLGAGIARSMAEAGARVICVDRASSEEVVSELGTFGRDDHRSEVVDVTDKDAIESLFASVAEDHGSLDVVVNNAGTYRVAEIVDETDESFETQFAVNTWSVFVSTRAAARIMKPQGRGRIINTASQLGKVGRPGYSVYSASKGAVILFTQSVALELGTSGITANCICPGSMHTALLSSADGRPADEYAASLGVDIDTAFQEYISDHIPVGRLGRPSDIGALATWLASDAAGFVTGSALNLTGGEQVFF